jgi:hypothetical protein
VTLGLAGIGVTILDVDEALAAQIAQALDALSEPDAGLRAELLARLAITRTYSPDRGESARIAARAVKIARRHGDPATLARALCAQHVSLGAPEHLEQRLQTANEMLELADRAGHRESALQARNFKVTDLLEAGDMAGFDREREAYAAACHQHPLPAFRWYIPLWTATRATINGALDEAAARRPRTRRRPSSGRSERRAVLAIQTGTLLLIQQRFDADVGWIEDHARSSPAGSAWWTVLAWIRAEQGRDAEARAIMDRLATNRFATLEKDTNWLPAIAELTHACRVLGDAERAAILYQHLLPFTGHIVAAARGAQAYGPVDYFLGLAAQTAGDTGAGRQHLSAALDLSVACDAHGWAHAARRHLTSPRLAARDSGRSIGSSRTP